MLERVRDMRTAAARGVGFDVVVVTAGSEEAASWWRRRLAATRGEVLHEGARLAVTVEGWPAGNALGTLLAVREAERDLGIDLAEHLRAGGSVGVFHAAGQGTRLAPLSLAEGGDKPRVRLPGLVRAGGEAVPITMLEAVLRSAAPLAPHRSGRLSVFWGDQVFVPSRDPLPARHHVVLAAHPLPVLDEAAWAARGLHRYGLVVVGGGGEGVQVEKIGHAAFRDLGLDESAGVFASLGAFHLSASCLQALRAEFARDLDARGHLDTDPDWWMPLTLPEPSYVALRAGAGVDPGRARVAWQRLATVKPVLASAHPTLGRLGVEDVGRDAAWWDFGTLAAYARMARRLLDDGEEGDALRAFFAVARDGDAVVAASAVTGRVVRSVLVDVAAEVDLDGAICVGVHAPRITGGGLAYGIRTEDALALSPGEALAGVAGTVARAPLEPR